LDPTAVFAASAGENGVKDLRLAQSTLQGAATFFQLDASRLQLWLFIASPPFIGEAQLSIPCGCGLTPNQWTPPRNSR
jgi:hypothetical protein